MASVELMPDGAQLSDKGYQVWADAVELPLKELMAGGKRTIRHRGLGAIFG